MKCDDLFPSRFANPPNDDLMRPNDLSIGRKIFAVAALANVCLALFWFGYNGVDTLSLA